MTGEITRYAVLRDRRLWDGVTLSGLDRQVDGTLVLSPVVGAPALGTLIAGPLDAGEMCDWERVYVDAEIGDGTVSLDIGTSDADISPPTVRWKTAPALDTLVAPADARAQLGSRRFLWIRVTLSMRADGVRPPQIAQVQSETTRGSYLDHLPAVYRRRDTDAFLERWLAMFRSVLGEQELTIEEISRRLDAAIAPEDHLAWLASWLGFPLPDGIDAEAARLLIARVPELYRRRGTPAGIADFVEIYAGVRPSITEAYQSRAIWQLGVTSQLGFDTGLADVPDGMIIAGLTPPDARLMGLRGEYYDGTGFDVLRATRVDAAVSFAWGSGSPHPAVPPNRFSIRWTGQICPRYSETYEFHTMSDDGVRLWIDGRLIIDNWTDHPPTSDTGRVALRAGKWSTIRLEYYENLGAATITLSWSSPSQRMEVIPPSRMYAVRDDAVRLAEADAAADDAIMMVGGAVVGETAPQTPTQFGSLLFSDTAHLFTVVVPAAAGLSTRQQQVLRAVIDAEKPAHTDYHLCCARPLMRVGVQATLGVDAIVAGPPEPMSMSGAILGTDSWLGAADDALPHGDDVPAATALPLALNPRR